MKSASEEKLHKTIPTEKLTTSEQEITSTIKKEKKPNIEEDHKVLLRDVSVLKKDFETLKGRIDKLELRLPMASSTPTKTPATSSVQDDGSKEKPNDNHRGVTTSPHYAHDPGYGQQDPGYREHNPAYRQQLPAYSQHDTGYPIGNTQYTSYI